MKSKAALVVAIALAFLAAIGIKVYLNQETQQAQAVSKKVPVVFSTKIIRKGTVVTGDMVVEREVPEDTVQATHAVLAGDLERILNKMPIQNTVAADQMLTQSDFREEGAAENPAAGLPRGYRQITIPVDKVTGCAGRLLPGAVVDVLVTLRKRSDAPGQGQIEPVTQLALAGVTVVATDLNVRRVQEFLSARERRDFASYSTVSLQALPLQSLLLAFLAEQGKIHLVVRNPDDPTGQDPSRMDKISLDDLDTIIRKAAEEKPESVPATR